MSPEIEERLLWEADTISMLGDTCLQIINIKSDSAITCTLHMI
jgi:hypothetical protein